MASVYENAVRVISKPPEERKVDEIRPLIFWFRKKSDIFRELTPGKLIIIITFNNSNDGTLGKAIFNCISKSHCT